MKTLDLFARCGGLSLGFQNAGFEIVGAIDNWADSIKVYEKNFNHKIFNKDLSKKESIDFVKKFNAEIIIGGSPCQDFSSAGKMQENKRADLTYKFADIVINASPEFFVLENVERITKSKILDDIILDFKNAGYGLTKVVLKASFYGVPQSRKRFFLIGHKFSNDDFIKKELEEGRSEKEMTIFDYFGNSLGLEYYYRHPRSYARRGVFSIYEPSPTIRGINPPIPKGYTKHEGDPVDITEDLRALTTKERSLIQTFPESFIFEGSKTKIEQMVGNAVPVKLAEFVAEKIMIYNNKIKQNERFRTKKSEKPL